MAACIIFYLYWPFSLLLGTNSLYIQISENQVNKMHTLHVYFTYTLSSTETWI